MKIKGWDSMENNEEWGCYDQLKECVMKQLIKDKTKSFESLFMEELKKRTVENLSKYYGSEFAELYFAKEIVHQNAIIKTKSKIDAIKKRIDEMNNEIIENENILNKLNEKDIVLDKALRSLRGI